MVVAGLLDHARDENLDPLFVLKGGGHGAATGVARALPRISMRLFAMPC